VATIRERKKADGSIAYQAQIRLKGFAPQNATFDRKTDAKRWIQQTEAAIREGTGSYRLAAVVHYLESAHHWSIFRYEQFEPTPDPIGRSAVFMRYMLTEEMIAWAGEFGKEWARDVLNLESKRIAEREAATSQSAEIKSGLLNTLAKQNNTRFAPFIGGGD